MGVIWTIAGINGLKRSGHGTFHILCESSSHHCSISTGLFLCCAKVDEEAMRVASIMVQRPWPCRLTRCVPIAWPFLIARCCYVGLLPEECDNRACYILVWVPSRASGLHHHYILVSGGFAFTVKPAVTCWLRRMDPEWLDEVANLCWIFMR